ncbi:MAG: cryptochrome/photolyase family protein [Methylococcus sp.]
MRESCIVWLRRDLRLGDNPALLAAVETGKRLIPVYIQEPESNSPWADGSASRWWLHHSLAALDAALRRLGSGLVIRRGPAIEVLQALASETGAGGIFWNRLYEPAAIERDTRVKQALREQGLRVDTYNGSLLYEPWEIRKSGGEPYRVFTPFWKVLLLQGLRRPPEPAPITLPPLPAGLETESLASLNLLPSIPWDVGFHSRWTVGEQGALQQLAEFIDDGLTDYKTGRDIPGQAGTSSLSPHLHFGEISPRQIVAVITRDGEYALGPGPECYLREIGWREFAYHLLFHFPHTAESPLDEKFTRLPWRNDFAEDLPRWQKGQTGYPIIDAGMRELWHTGWMHNRVRMIAASLLTKNLLIPWLEGARWFWDTLVDADLASNTLGWQWTAGCGADAAPYFRIFNPVLQGERFDPEGHYVRRWVPELARLPAAHIHQPWEAGELRLGTYGVRLGRDYPLPMVDLKFSRQRALDAFAAIKAA